MVSEAYIGTPPITDSLLPSSRIASDRLVSQPLLPLCSPIAHFWGDSFGGSKSPIADRVDAWQGSRRWRRRCALSIHVRNDARAFVSGEFYKDHVPPLRHESRLRVRAVTLTPGNNNELFTSPLLTNHNSPSDRSPPTIVPAPRSLSAHNSLHPPSPHSPNLLRRLGTHDWLMWKQVQQPTIS